MSEPRTALDLIDEINKKLEQSRGICEMVRTNPNAKAITGAISDSLWAVDELLEDAKKAAKGLYHLR